MSRYLFYFAIAWILALCAYALVLAIPIARAQVPACLNDAGTPVPCPTPVATAMPVPATPTPQPTPLPAVPARNTVFQNLSVGNCGIPPVVADLVGGNTYWRVAVTKNGVVDRTLDGFGVFPSWYTDPLPMPGTIYRAYAFVRETAPVFVVGQLHTDLVTGLSSQWTATGLAPCLPPTPVVFAAPVSPTPTLAQAVSTVVAANAPAATPVQVPSIRPPSTGDGGLVQ